MSKWETKVLGSIITFQRGYDLPYRIRERGSIPVISSAGIIDFHQSLRVEGPGVVTGRYGTIGEIFYIDQHFWPLNTTLYVRDFQGNDPRFVYYLLQRFNFHSFSGKSGVPGVNRNDLHAEVVSFPTDREEQQAIVDVLSDVDTLIVGLEKMIAKKRDLKQAAMQQLLTGQTRLPEFHGKWKEKHIFEIASPTSERNSTNRALPVLACSKHLGFVDSLSYFKNQVFSRDLSTYKVIRRGEIGYPANHIEEGSIGLQNLYDEALVSPIYVTFQVNIGINGFFLHRLLKLDSYREIFQTETASSVDRRGSLRWKAFSNIVVKLPPTEEEQVAIADFLADMEADLAVLETRLAKTHTLKQGMMQELLTGRTRLV